jgi:hypothetical protein
MGVGSGLMLNYEREAHMTNEPVIPADYAAVLSDLQDSSRYGDLVLSLRSDHRLHPFVEWHLEHLLRAHHAGQMHVQAEKNGISNGRIDLVAYGGTRSVIHFELIASNSGGHVFRDTTSLLGSKADARLARLIDEDLDADVCKNYKRAIPLPTIVEDVPLRMVLLKRNEAAFNVTVPSLPPTPTLLLDPSAAHVGATVNFRVQHFPQDTELGVTFWQGHSGRGVFTGMLGATGELSGSFRIPPIVNGFNQPGWHNVEASTSGRPASARAQINVTPCLRIRW